MELPHRDSPDRGSSAGNETAFDQIVPCVTEASTASGVAVVCFSGTMFLSSFLLFAIEPMVAKMVLPLLGGTPAVWNTCLVFFQAVLLAGYSYAHLSAKLLAPRRQIVLHLVLLLSAAAVLPIHVPLGWLPPVNRNPAPWLLALLTVAVGLPFFVLSASTPIFQKWFSYSDDSASKDPYFLYVASNAGSLAGLLSYPVLVEPTLRLATQSRLLMYGYGLLFVLTAGCGALIWGAPQTARSEARTREEAIGAEKDESSAPSTKRRLRWIVLAFVPASLTLGVTTALTTDMPAIPLLWVLPLGLYLLSFIFAFARKPLINHEWLVRRLPFLILAAMFPIVSRSKLPILLWIPLDLLTLFGIAMVCHGELVRSRPSTKHLTEFYLWISVGGVLGGIFNALLAPIVFSSVIEFPLVLVFAAMLRPPLDVKSNSRRDRMLDVLLPAVLGLTLLAVIMSLQAVGLKPGRAMNILIFGFSLEWCLSFGKRPMRFAAGLVAIMLASSIYTGPYGHILHTERSFFGVNRVTDDDDKQFRMLFHGGTIHGIQALDAARAQQPLGYYAEPGPIAQIFSAFAGSPDEKRVAIVGLGTGALACYAHAPRELTYYEIDPSVRRIAENPNYFTFLRDCSPQVHVVLGDARMSLQSAPDHQYGMMVIDAFSGDSIPVHLVTREALQLYLRKLTPDGVLVFHITNLYLNLRPVIGALAADAGLTALIGDDSGVSEAEIKKGRYPSVWVVAAHNSRDLGTLAHDARWKPLTVKPGARVWTDDFSSVLSIVKWN